MRNLVILSIVTLCVAFYVYGINDEDWPLRLELQKSSAAIWGTDKKTLVIKTVNQSLAQVHVGSFVSSCSCTSVTPQEVIVPTSSSSNTIATIALEPTTDEQAAMFKRDVTANLVAVSMTGTQLAAPLSIELRVLSPAVRDMQKFDFKSVSIVDEVTQTMDVTLWSGFTCSGVDVQPPIAKASVVEKKEGKLTVAVHSLRDVPLGLHRAYVELRLASSYVGGPQKYRIPLLM